LTYLRAKKGTEHALDIERAFWFGEKNSDSSGTQGHPRRSTGGILEFISSSGAYTQDAGGTLTVTELNTFLREGFTYGSDQKTMFVGGLVLQAINEFARGQILMQPLASSYGMQIGKWVTAFGTVNLVHNPLFVGSVYGGAAFLLDMECFKYRYMNNRDTKLYTNVQSPDVDGQIDQYVSEVGLQRMQASKCAYLYGVTG